MTTTTPKPTRLIEPSYPYDEHESYKAYQEWGCNCGPSALATMINLKPDDVRPHIKGFDEKKYTSPTMMKDAIASLGLGFVQSGVTLDPPPYPFYGVIRIQWDGPWCRPEVPKRVAYRYTHWIGAMTFAGSLYVFDVNSGWSRKDVWEKETVPTLTKLYPKSNGKYFPTHIWNIAIPTQPN